MHECITKSLREGTVFDYLDECRQRNWGVIITNSNLNYTQISKKKIPEHSTNREHMLTIYDKIISKVKSKHIMLVAHSFGGCLCNELLDRRPSILEKLVSIAYTDSVHGNWKIYTKNEKGIRFLKKRCRNWKRDGRRLDYDFGTVDGVSTVSASTQEHTLVSFVIVKSVFRYFETCIIETSMEMKEKGNGIIKKGSIDQALVTYNSAFGLLIKILKKSEERDQGDEEEDEGEVEERTEEGETFSLSSRNNFGGGTGEVTKKNFFRTYVSLQSNIILCLMKQENYGEAIEKAEVFFRDVRVMSEEFLYDVSQAIKIKVRKRKAFCLIRMGRNEDARKELEIVLKENGEDEEAKILIEKLNSKN